MAKVALPKIAVAALGGTIAMRPAKSGEPVVPKMSADDLLAAIPELASYADVTATTISTSPSPSTTIADLLSAYEWARQQLDSGADGIVFSHGTDTLEESAFFLDLVWQFQQPLVLTGAMRSPNLLSSDGAANLFGAIVTAGSQQASGLGVLVAMNDTVHLARHVRKSDSHALDAFTSSPVGPIGCFRENRFEKLWPCSPEQPKFSLPGNTSINIPIFEAGFAEDGSFLKTALDCLPEGSIDALVIDGSGVGHVSAPLAEIIEQLVAAGTIVVVSSRTDHSGTARNLYGYLGSESDLQSKGAILAGQLTGRKARIALHLMLDAGWSVEQIKNCFARYW